MAKPRLSPGALSIREVILNFEAVVWNATERDRMEGLNSSIEYFTSSFDHLPHRAEHHNYLLGVIRHYFSLIKKDKTNGR